MKGVSTLTNRFHSVDECFNEEIIPEIEPIPGYKSETIRILKSTYSALYPLISTVLQNGSTSLFIRISNGSF